MTVRRTLTSWIGVPAFLTSVTSIDAQCVPRVVDGDPMGGDAAGVSGVTAGNRTWCRRALIGRTHADVDIAFWSSLAHLRLDLDSVELAHYAVTGVRGELHVDPSQIALRRVEASMWSPECRWF